MNENLTKEKIFELRNKYLGKKKTGWTQDSETKAIIVYATNEVYFAGKYYSLENAKEIKKCNYAQSIRQFVGHMPLQLSGTGIVVYRTNQEGKIEILLQLRSDFDKYGLPGGGIENGETYQECAIHELHQETALKANVADLVLLNVYAGPKHVTKYPNGDIVYHTVVVYKIDYAKCKKTNDRVDKNETKALKWVAIQEIRKILDNKKVFPNNIPILEDVVNVFFEKY